MNISSVNQLFNEKMQDINSRLPANTSVSNKFQSLLEETQLKNTSATSTENTSNVVSEATSNDTDINSLLKTMMSTQATLNSTSAFSSSDSSSIFPTSTFNNAISTLQQTQLLNALNKTSSTK